MVESVKYIIGSGWWCSDSINGDKRDKYFGSDAVREQGFHKYWYKSICQFSNPEKIFIVDSASPVLPELSGDDPRVEFVSLSENGGHATHHIGKYSGWSRAVLLGMEYALVCDADYFVYVEQDVLLKGTGVIEHCIGRMNSSYMFGSGQGTPQLLQQSFFIIGKEGIRRFISRFHKIDAKDSELSPEDKFYIASSRASLGLMTLFLKVIRKNKRRKKYFFNRWILRLAKNYDDLPIGYGRARPISFKDKFFYFQHGTDTELSAYFKMVLD